MLSFIVTIPLIIFSLLAGLSCAGNNLKTNETSKTQNEFVIYFFTHSQAEKFNTDIYKYDAGWVNFLNNAGLSGVKLTDENIEWYNWDKQQIRLTASGKEIFSAFIKSSENEKPSFRYWEKPFIVTLRGKRLYAGRIEIMYSQMAIRYPVISYGENGGNDLKKFDENPVLLLFPHLVTPSKDDINSDDKTTVFNPDISNYFKDINKLKN